MARPTAPADSPAEVPLAGFGRYLAAGTVRGYVSHARRFLDGLPPGTDLAGLSAKDVTEAVLRESAAVSVSANAVLRCRAAVISAPYLDQGGALRRRWPGVSAGLCPGRPARRTQGHTCRRACQGDSSGPQADIARKPFRREVAAGRRSCSLTVSASGPGAAPRPSSIGSPHRLHRPHTRNCEE